MYYLPKFIVNRRTVTWSLVLASISWFGIGFANAQVISGQIEDNDILDAVEKELVSDDSVPHHLIDVRVSGGIVTLGGTSDTLLGRRRAAELVSSLKGVRAVVNRVRVLPVGRNDKEILADVQAALRDDPVADEEQLRIKVDQGRVTLEGAVDSFPEKRLSEMAVAGVRGVTEIDNQITILAKTARPDSEIKPEIVRRMELNPFLSKSSINVQVIERCGEA